MEFDYFPTPAYMERYDGSRWRTFDLNRGGTLLLTSRGQELFSHNPSLRNTLLNYKRDAQNNVQSDVRHWFKSGGNSDVFKVGNHGLVMKESSPNHSVLLALNRMDFLYGICLRFLPPHIRVPDHLGAYYSPSDKKQYLLMQMVNQGLTVEDIIENETEGYDIDSSQRASVIEEFQGLEDKIKQAIVKSPGQDQLPGSLLPDWHAGNVIADFDTPTKDFPFTFWIIDQ